MNKMCGSEIVNAHKEGVVRTLLMRADRICSNITARDVEKKQVAGALSNNGNPTGLVKRNWQPPPMNLHLSTSELTELWWSSRTPDTSQNPSDASSRRWEFAPVLNHITPCGTNPCTAESRSDLQDPVQGLPQGVCRPNRQNFDPPAEGAEVGSEKQQSGTVSSSGARGTSGA